MDKELFIMRHAKSAWDKGVTDKERPLKKRGMSAARRIGDGLKRLGWIPDIILLSPAKRAQQTCKLLALDTPVKIDNRIYSAQLDDLFAVLGETPEDIKKVMLLGHNPALESLLLHLTPHAERQKNGKLLTTANVARIGITGKWADMKTHQARGKLLGLIRPKEIT